MLKRSHGPKAGKPALAIVRPIDDAKTWAAYSALEGNIRDLERMATLAMYHVQEPDQWLDREQYEGILNFLVVEVSLRAVALRKMYDEGSGDEAPRGARRLKWCRGADIYSAGPAECSPPLAPPIGRA
jgi:hypothetical protein